MAFGLPDIGGLSFLDDIDFSGILSTVGAFITGILVFLVLAALVGLYYYRKGQAKLYNKKVHFFEEVNGIITPINDYQAAELTIPNTSIQVFYIKTIDLYLPRPTLKMGKDSYWYMIRKNREIVNFKMKDMDKEMAAANLDYDHTDMRYAMTNLRELIKRNYRDNSKPWWKEYKETISVVIIIVVLTISLIFIFNKMGGLIGQIGQLIEHADQLVQSANSVSGSGVQNA